jgi:hypothetical protein
MVASGSDIGDSSFNVANAKSEKLEATRKQL